MAQRSPKFLVSIIAGIEILAILPNQKDNFSGLAYVGEKDEEETMFISMPQVIFQLVLQIQIQFIQM